MSSTNNAAGEIIPHEEDLENAADIATNNMASQTNTEINPEIDLNDVRTYLEKTGMSASNIANCMRVVKKLVTGVGVTHKNKPGETFFQGHRLTLTEDLEEVRQKANAFLPRILDGGNGWALNHPIQKLINYKKYILGIEPLPEKKKRKRAP